MDLLKKYLNAEPEEVETGSYGYVTDEVKVNPFTFGLNQNVFMTKFEWIPNGGKDGAEQEAIDIVFNINNTNKSYRMFPVTQAFKKDSNEKVTDPKAPEFKEALVDFNARITHIMHAFMDIEVYKAAMSKPIKSFKDFAKSVTELLPKDFATKPLDIFLQYDWQVSEGQTKTYLDIPTKMKYGAWLKPAQGGEWKEMRLENPTDRDTKALWYINKESGVEHPFTKNGWFMQSKFANQQGVRGASATPTGKDQGTQAAAQTQQDGAAKASAW